MRTEFRFGFCAVLLLIFAAQAATAAVTLEQCGKVIGHEMGLWEFFALNPGPEQVTRVLKSPLNFIKISLQQLKDGSWVVYHDDSIYIYDDQNNAINIQFNQVTWAEIEDYKSRPGYFVPIYRLKDYVDRDPQGKLCWMFSPKESPDVNFVNDLIELGISDRSVILTYGLSDVINLSAYPESDHLHFAGRVSTDEKALAAYAPYLNRLWAMEIDPTSDTQNMVNLTHQMGIKAYVDSMRYSWNYELFGTACKTVFDMGVDYSQSNRPLQCIDEYRLGPPCEWPEERGARQTTPANMR